MRDRLGLLAGFVGVLVALPAWGASYQTTNFFVTASKPEVARMVAEYAERYRRSEALEWLGHELGAWEPECQVEVRVGFGGAGGATSFTFERGQVLRQHMVVEGPLERILHSVLPHEVTHTIFAAKFGRPLPRWADEGGAVLSEDDLEIRRHDLLVRELINTGRMIPLRRLFLLTAYPQDVMALYTQGFSITRFLVSLRGKRTFLEFVQDGGRHGWEYAAERHYGFGNLKECEDRWIAWLIAGKGTGADSPPVIAENQPGWLAKPLRVIRSQIPGEPSGANPPLRSQLSIGTAMPTVTARDKLVNKTEPYRRRLTPFAVGRTRRSQSMVSSGD